MSDSNVHAATQGHRKGVRCRSCDPKNRSTSRSTQRTRFTEVPSCVIDTEQSLTECHVPGFSVRQVRSKHEGVDPLRGPGFSGNTGSHQKGGVSRAVMAGEICCDAEPTIHVRCR